MFADGDDAGQQLGAGLMVDAGVEKHVGHQVVGELRPFHVLRQAAVAPPMIRHRAAAMGDDELERGEVGEQIPGQQLHERRGVTVDVMRPGAVEVRVAGRADMDHRRHVELGHRLIERIPGPVGDWRPGPIAAGRVRVEVAADEAELQHAAPQLGDACVQGGAGRLRQLADADEIARKQGADPVDQVVAGVGPARCWRRRRRRDGPCRRRGAKRW